MTRLAKILGRPSRCRRSRHVAAAARLGATSRALSAGRARRVVRRLLPHRDAAGGQQRRRDRGRRLRDPGDLRRPRRSPSRSRASRRQSRQRHDNARRLRGGCSGLHELRCDGHRVGPHGYAFGIAGSDARLRVTPLRVAPSSSPRASPAPASPMRPACRRLGAALGRQAVADEGDLPARRVRSPDTWVDETNQNQANGGEHALRPDNKHDSRVRVHPLHLGSCGLATTGGADSATLSLAVTPRRRRTTRCRSIPSARAGAATLTWNAAAA